ncbi:MAG: hypothetical protein PHQ27_03475 [Victivallales bacterium]|nr:hypothetical protein [Victivallales bacterium]
MTQDKNTEFLRHDGGAVAPENADANSPLEPASPEQEIARLNRLKTSDLLHEFYFARQRMKSFLESHGINVPELRLEQEQSRPELDMATAVYLENFTRSSIRNIGVDVNCVSSSVKSFVVLFDSLISTNAFEDANVMIEGSDEIRTVRQLLEDYDNNRIGDDRKVVISALDLKQQLDSLIDDTSSGSKNFEDVDDKAIAAARNKPEDKMFHPEAQDFREFSNFSPYISQEIFDGLFRQHAEDFTLPGEPDPEMEALSAPVESTGSPPFVPESSPPATAVTAEDIAAADSGIPAEPEDIFDDNAEIPREYADIFDDNANISDEEIERLLGEKNKWSAPSLDSKAEPGLSLDDINRIFGEDAPVEQAAKPEPESPPSPNQL